MKFSIKVLFSKCDQIRKKKRIWSHLLKKSLRGKLIFCTVLHEVSDSVKQMNMTKGPNFIYSEKRLSRAKLVLIMWTQDGFKHIFLTFLFFFFFFFRYWQRKWLTLIKRLFCICSRKWLEWPKPVSLIEYTILNFYITSTRDGCSKTHWFIFYPVKNSWTIALLPNDKKIESYKFFRNTMHFYILGVLGRGNLTFLSPQGWWSHMSKQIILKRCLYGILPCGSMIHNLIFPGSVATEREIITVVWIHK